MKTVFNLRAFNVADKGEVKLYRGLKAKQQANNKAPDVEHPITNLKVIGCADVAGNPTVFVEWEELANAD